MRRPESSCTVAAPRSKRFIMYEMIRTVRGSPAVARTPSATTTTAATKISPSDVFTAPADKTKWEYQT